MTANEMTTDELLIFVARAEDASAWVRLTRMASGAPPPTAEEEQAEVAEFRGALCRVPDTHFIARRGPDAVGLFEFRLMGSAVELRRIYLLNGLMGTYGPALLGRAVQEARRHGDMLTVESFPASDSRMYSAAGFTVNTRTRMIASLADYQPRPITPPEGITMRTVMLDDEPLFARMAYEHYKGTVDEPMVSRSPAQAEILMRALFHNEYALLEPAASSIALDRNGNAQGGIIVSSQTTDPADTLAWVLDISIAERWRGRGLGKALLHSAMNAAHDLSYRHMGLMVTESNETALRAYRSLGFESYGDTMYEGWIEL